MSANARLANSEELKQAALALSAVNHPILSKILAGERSPFLAHVGLVVIEGFVSGGPGYVGSLMFFVHPDDASTATLLLPEGEGGALAVYVSTRDEDLEPQPWHKPKFFGQTESATRQPPQLEIPTDREISELWDSGLREGLAGYNSGDFESVAEMGIEPIEYLRQSFAIKLIGDTSIFVAHWDGAPGYLTVWLRTPEGQLTWVDVQAETPMEMVTVS